MLARVRAYAAHPDPLAATTCLIATIVAWNTPFYPFYLWVAVGRQGLPAIFLTLCSLPFFAAVPPITRRNSLLGRALLPLVGTVNTLFCTWVLGEASGTELYLLPCMTIAALSFRPAERRVMLPLVALPALGYLVLHGRYGAPAALFSAAAVEAMFAISAFSAGALTIVLGLIYAPLVAEGAPAPDRNEREG